MTLISDGAERLEPCVQQESLLGLRAGGFVGMDEF